MLVSSHILGELSRLAGRFGFIERGRLLREISAAELEEACGRRLVLHMNGIVRFGEAMEKLGVRKFRAVSPTVCEVETDLSVSALAFALREVGLEILRVAEKEADLEGYFMRLIGGRSMSGLLKADFYRLFGLNFSIYSAASCCCSPGGVRSVCPHRRIRGERSGER